MMSDRHFQGNGIRLRAPEPEDLEVMFRFENATDVWEMSNTTGPYSRFQLKQYIEQTQNDLFADRQLRLIASMCEEDQIAYLNNYVRNGGQIVSKLDQTVAPWL